MHADYIPDELYKVPNWQYKNFITVCPLKSGITSQVWGGLLVCFVLSSPEVVLFTWLSLLIKIVMWGCWGFFGVFCKVF